VGKFTLHCTNNFLVIVKKGQMVTNWLS